jgi:hypothetical protein
VTGLPGPGHVTTGIGGLGMTKRTRDPAKWGTGGVTGGNGQVTRLAGQVAPARSGSLAHRVVPAHLACRIGARAQAGGAQRLAGAAGNFTAGVTVRSTCGPP